MLSLAENILISSWQPDSDPLEATFELNDTLYAKAEVPPTEEVYLWLGVRIPMLCFLSIQSSCVDVDLT